MGQVLHGSATTTEAVRRAIQRSQESLRALARRYGVNPKTIAKWKARSSVSDLPTGPREPRSTALSVEEEAVVVAFRRHTLLPLDDCLYALQPTIPHLTRSSLHRCLQRHGISRLPQVEGETSPKRKFKAYPIGYFHIDIAEARTAEGVAFAFAQQMPDEHRELTGGRDSGDMLTAAGADSQEERPQRTRRSRCRPSRLDEHAARMPTALLRDPAVIRGPGTRLAHTRVEAKVAHQLLRLLEASRSRPRWRAPPPCRPLGLSSGV